MRYFVGYNYFFKLNSSKIKDPIFSTLDYFKLCVIQQFCVLIPNDYFKESSYFQAVI